VALSAGGFGLAQAFQAADEPETPPLRSPALQKFMRGKLALSQGILEGLVVEDFERIEKNSAGLMLMSAAAQWQVSNDPIYKQHSNEFQRTVKQLQKAAKEKNLDGASLGFVQLTMNCIECHRFTRTVLLAK
jgi:hypothetical protein